MNKQSTKINPVHLDSDDKQSTIVVSANRDLTNKNTSHINPNDLDFSNKQSADFILDSADSRQSEDLGDQGKIEKVMSDCHSLIYMKVCFLRFSSTTPVVFFVLFKRGKSECTKLS